MKNKLVVLFSMAGILFLMACNKMPKDVVISADKTTAHLGDTINFTITAGDFRSRASAYPFADLYVKKPGAANFSRGVGIRMSDKPYKTDLLDFWTDSTYATGTYSFYAKVRNCKDVNDDGCKYIANSSEITVTITQ